MILCLVILVVFGLVFLMASPRTSFDAEALMSSFLYQRSVSGVVQILYLLLAIPFMMWLYRAHHNLVTAKVAGVTWRSHWSFTGFFIPVANLLIPYQFVREVWNLTPSLPRTTNSSGLMQKSSLVGLWWACLLSANVIGVTALVVLSWTMTGGDYLSALRVPQAIAILSSLMLIAAAILTVLLVNEISRLQVAWSEGTNAVRYDPLTVILSLIIVLAIALLIIVVEKAFVVASPL